MRLMGVTLMINVLISKEQTGGPSKLSPLAPRKELFFDIHHLAGKQG